MPVTSARNNFGDPAEEFEIQFIDGDSLDFSLADSLGIDQANITRFLDMADEWDDDQKNRFIIAVGECGYSSDCDPSSMDMDGRCLTAARSIRCANQACSLGPPGDDRERSENERDFNVALFSGQGRCRQLREDEER